MPAATQDASSFRLSNAAGIAIEVNANGSLRRFDCGAVSLLLFIGSEIEGGPANLYLRARAQPGQPWSCTALLGPSSPSRLRSDATSASLLATGSWMQMEYALRLALAADRCAWFWQLALTNTGPAALELDLTYAQDLALAPYGAVRMNEYFVSQYLDHAPLSEANRGWVVASRQNQAVDGKYPWSLLGSLRRAVAFSTDALQFHGVSSRTGTLPPALQGDLPAERLQHEHSMVALRDAALTLKPGASTTAGFFGLYLADHPEASSPADLDRIGAVLALPEASAGVTRPKSAAEVAAGAAGGGTLFSEATLFPAVDLSEAELQGVFPGPWRHEERDEHGQLLSFFCGPHQHVVLKQKELRVLRPHGQLLRTGLHITPAESSLTSTVWMSGVFHSMVTQGHVNINRFLSAVHSYLGLFRAQGQRVFVEREGRWQLLQLPSAFEMSPSMCRWIYHDGRAMLEVRAEAHSDPHALALSISLDGGEPVRFLVTHHLALGGDDGAARSLPRWDRDSNTIVVMPPPGGEIARRFPRGRFRIETLPGAQLERIGGDELLYPDGRSRGEPYLCLVTAASKQVGLRLKGELIDQETQSPLVVPDPRALLPALALHTADASAAAAAALGLADFAPWCAQNALVHYLAPRGLEQYSGGGWGTRDVCQGPVELLLALGRTDAIREVLRRVMAAQNADGDWPQWFMFFERERMIRAGDSHGDIVLWPLVVLAQYLIATSDAALLEEQIPFFDPKGPESGELATVWEHARRALELGMRRVIGGTALAAYGHGDWNDSLQPADPRMREHLCSAWTVTLQVQALMTLVRALRLIQRSAEAEELERQAQRVRQDFQRLLMADGVLTGYALFEEAGRVRYLLHPRDQETGVHYSALAMIHAILEDLFTPDQAQQHLQMLETKLQGPDGVRLFDRPFPYYGGVQRLFQRAETATFFGREIGLMYTHAHLRYAQALAHLGEAERFFQALCQANPIAMRALVPSATPRQANCYYSSSDAAFADRYQASREYSRVVEGSVALDGGWRVYSSGAGITLSLIMRYFLGLSVEAAALRIDPVIPATLDGLRLETTLWQRPVQVRYRIRGRGCGVNAVRVNGAAVSFSREANPYRPGAAIVAVTDLQPLLEGERERGELSIEFG
jgi:1,2-beta-oligoglucan phosphorylase